MTEQIFNLDDPREKRMLLETIRVLAGTFRFSWCRHRKRRSDRQNRYYWPCFVQPFADYMREQDGNYTAEMAHETFKLMFLATTIIDKKTGHRLTHVRSTTELNTLEFNEYLDNVAKLLADDFGFVVADPDLYREKIAA